MPIMMFCDKEVPMDSFVNMMHFAHVDTCYFCQASAPQQWNMKAQTKKRGASQQCFKV